MIVLIHLAQKNPYNYTFWGQIYVRSFWKSDFHTIISRNKNTVVQDLVPVRPAITEQYFGLGWFLTLELPGHIIHSSSAGRGRKVNRALIRGGGEGALISAFLVRACKKKGPGATLCFFGSNFFIQIGMTLIAVIISRYMTLYHQWINKLLKREKQVWGGGGLEKG